MKAIGKKLDRYRNPWLELKIQYGQNKGKLYNEECDRFMVRLFRHFFSLFCFSINPVTKSANFCWLKTDVHDPQTWVWELGGAKGSIQDIAIV